MVQISKREAEQLRKNGFGESVKRSHSKSPKFYLVEDYKPITELNKIRTDSNATNLEKVPRK